MNFDFIPGIQGFEALFKLVVNFYHSFSFYLKGENLVNRRLLRVNPFDYQVEES